MRLLAGLIGAALLGAAAQAAVIGRTTPAEPLTSERLAALPDRERPPWVDYLARSQAAHRLDVATLEVERRAGSAPAPPEAGNAAASMPLDRAPAWYASDEARHIANVIVSFQTPAGGWGKNSARTGAVRQPGQTFGREAGYVGTLDNDATVTELRFLAKVIAAAPTTAEPFRQSFTRGVRYLLAAQLPNGGWPQVWPLVGGYHDAVTFNDGAMVAATGLLGEVAAGRGDYAWTPPALRDEARLAQRRAIACLLAAQIVVDGRSLGWPQQSDPITLQPVGARNFEPRSLATAESAGILTYLMSLPDPSPEVMRAVHDGAAWLLKAALADKAWIIAAEPGVGHQLIDRQGASLWARFHDIETGRPIFGDRDLTIHDDVTDLSAERRNGYAWFGTAPATALVRYAVWARAHPARTGT